jgi:hypothetical protein
MLLLLVQTAEGSIRRSLAAEIKGTNRNIFRAYATVPGTRKPYGSTPQQSPFDAERHVGLRTPCGLMPHLDGATRTSADKIERDVHSREPA